MFTGQFRCWRHLRRATPTSFFFRLKLSYLGGCRVPEAVAAGLPHTPCFPRCLMRQESHRRAAEDHLHPSSKTGRDWPVMSGIRKLGVGDERSSRSAFLVHGRRAQSAPRRRPARSSAEPSARPSGAAWRDWRERLGLRSAWPDAGAAGCGETGPSGSKWVFAKPREVRHYWHGRLSKP